MNKDILLKICSETLAKTKVQVWYNKNLEDKPQENTITQLLKGIADNEISIREALHISFIVGFQWSVNFKNE